jgi:hypothetical protein
VFSYVGLRVGLVLLFFPLDTRPLKILHNKLRQCVCHLFFLLTHPFEMFQVLHWQNFTRRKQQLDYLFEGSLERGKGPKKPGGVL